MGGPDLGETGLQSGVAGGSQDGAEGASDGPPPTLADLSEAARARLIHFIVTTTLAAGAPPVEVAALYADLAGDEQAVRYADERFMHRQVPPGWHDVQDRVVILEEAARTRGVDLAGSWLGATDAALGTTDPLGYLARLAGLPADVERRAQRSIFDDPDDLDNLDNLAESDLDDEARLPLLDREPDLVDIEAHAQSQIRRFAIEERLEGGLPPFELLELYRQLEIAEDDRARQYLDRIFVQRDPPPDWLNLQARARRAVEEAAARGKDAARIYASVMRSFSGMDPLVALERTMALIISG